MGFVVHEINLVPGSFSAKITIGGIARSNCLGTLGHGPFHIRPETFGDKYHWLAEDVVCGKTTRPSLSYWEHRSSKGHASFEFRGKVLASNL